VFTISHDGTEKTKLAMTVSEAVVYPADAVRFIARTKMVLSTRELAVLRALAAACQKLVEEAEVGDGPEGAQKLTARSRAATGRRPRRIRRTGQELQDFRRMLLDERRKGTPVAELARKYNISTAYIYNLNS
jgi:hypothetical protein